MWFDLINWQVQKKGVKYSQEIFENSKAVKSCKYLVSPIRPTTGRLMWFEVDDHFVSLLGPSIIEMSTQPNVANYSFVKTHSIGMSLS